MKTKQRRIATSPPVLSGTAVECDDYATAAPFPHVVIDGMFRCEACALATTEAVNLPREKWMAVRGEMSRRWVLRPSVLADCHLRRIAETLVDDGFVSLLSQITGHSGLSCDIDRDFMIYMDFTGASVPVSAWRSRRETSYRTRRLSCRLFLTPRWDETWGGAFVLSAAGKPDVCEKSISPVGGRLLLISSGSVYGSPSPLACPVDVARISVVAHYWSDTSEQHAGRESEELDSASFLSSMRRAKQTTGTNK